MSDERTTFREDFKRFFGRGLAVLLPTVLTLWLVVHAYLFVERQVAEPINRGIRQAVIWIIPRALSEESQPGWFRVTDRDLSRAREIGDLEPRFREMSDADMRARVRAAKFQERWNEHWYFRFIGLFVAIILIYLAGRFLGGFIGRRVYTRVEGLMTRVPIFKQVYPHVKQLVDMVLGDRPMAFRKAVLVQYPRKGIWTVGLMTSSSMRVVKEQAGDEVISIFIPSTPTPFTGFTINVPKKDTIDLPISIDEAIRFFITGGALIPEGQANEARDTIAKARLEAAARGTALPSGGDGDVGEKSAGVAGPERDPPGKER